jgi:hypothetical protein
MKHMRWLGGPSSGHPQALLAQTAGVDTVLSAAGMGADPYLVRRRAAFSSATRMVIVRIDAPKRSHTEVAIGEAGRKLGQRTTSTTSTTARANSATAA